MASLNKKELLNLQIQKVQNTIHLVNEKTYYKFTYCDLCKQLLVGIYKQGVKCQSNFFQIS